MLGAHKVAINAKTLLRSCLKVNMSSETPEFIASVQINENGDDHICRHCERTFRSNRGLNQHLRS